jgi:hypothetical protein
MDGGDRAAVLEPGDHVADSHVHRLLVEYARLVGAPIRKTGTSLLELQLPEQERKYFNNRSNEFVREGKLRVSTDPAARVDDADVELAVSGSAFLDQLVGAIRERGQRLRLGLLPAGRPLDADRPQLSVPADGAAVSVGRAIVTVHPIGRLLVRVLVRAGAAAEELLIESDTFDLAAGRPVPRDVAAQCGAAVDGSPEPAVVPQDAVVRGARPIEGLLRAMLSDLEGRLAPAFEKRRAESQKSLAVELGRIDTYYRNLLDGSSGPGTEIASGDARRAFEAEHSRRRQEEINRHELRATIQPVQIVQWELLVQDAEWTITSQTGHSGVVSAIRPLTGSGTWILSCPTCGELPSALRVCREGHVCCSRCSQSCTMCAETSCRDHVPASCHIDDASVCAAHARTCIVCRKPVCLQHVGACAEGDHKACSSCLVACAVCGRNVCTSHVSVSPASAPKGSRRLCRACVVLCEGGKNEPVGSDEVSRCASCTRHVCRAHQAACAVDGRVHCSAHLRRMDRSRRLACEQHQAACAYEPAAVFAADEVFKCVSCGAAACADHVGTCAHDGAVHCRHHLAPLADQLGQSACDRHRATCHVDQKNYSLGAVVACPACARETCRDHLRTCALILPRSHGQSDYAAKRFIRVFNSNSIGLT